MSCYCYIQGNNSSLILTLRSKLISYQLSKGFVIIEKISQALKNFTKTVEKFIDAINIYDNDSIMIQITPITPLAKTLNNIYYVGPLCNELISEYYNERNDAYCTVVSTIYS